MYVESYLIELVLVNCVWWCVYSWCGDNLYLLCGFVILKFVFCLWIFVDMKFELLVFIVLCGDVYCEIVVLFDVCYVLMFDVCECVIVEYGSMICVVLINGSIGLIVVEIDWLLWFMFVSVFGVGYEYIDVVYVKVCGIVVVIGVGINDDCVVDYVFVLLFVVVCNVV